MRGRPKNFKEPVKSVQVRVPLSKVEDFKKKAERILKQYKKSENEGN